MGYYSTFETKVLDANDITKSRAMELERVIDDSKRYSQIANGDTSMYKDEYLDRLKKASSLTKNMDLEEIVSCMNQSGIKWYSWREDLIKLSKAFPEFILQVRRDGEESEDIEMVWFHNGKVQGGPAKVVFPDFDPKGFKTPSKS